MLDGALRPEAIRHVGDDHRALALSLGLPVETGSGEDALGGLKRATIASFGFEWNEYRRFGWDDPEYDLERERDVFLRKSLLAPNELAGRLVLDAGCGNGRYAYLASANGGRVIGVDLSDAVDAAAENTAAVKDVQIVQADIFRLPFAPGTFDVIFSIGVLMHTGDAALAVRRLRSLVTPGGSLSVHLYGKGNRVYELVDRRLRGWTTRRTIPELRRFTDRAYGLERFLSRVHLNRVANRFVRLDPHPHCIFDWYSAPVATHHTYAEVLGWFGELDLRVVATNERTPVRGLPASIRSVVGSADTVTVRGRAG
jgi:SAM-dependent methyltransferase